jgi:regulator of protease activity HflC (stomatin/prohibitin superfamily)
VDVSAVAYFRVVDAVKSVVAIENVNSAIDQIAQTTLRKVVGQHTLDETLSETDRINLDIRAILDKTTADWGIEVTLVELKDIQLPDSMKRAMARQAEAEREKRAKIINAEGESLAAAALGDASDVMMAHPLALRMNESEAHLEGRLRGAALMVLANVQEISMQRNAAPLVRLGLQAPAPTPCERRSRFGAARAG